MILQAIVDNNYRFRNIYCGSPGSCHDAAVFQTSKLYKNYNLLIPKIGNENGIKCVSALSYNRRSCLSVTGMAHQRIH